MEIERANMILPGEQLCPEVENYKLSNQFNLTLDCKIIANQYGEVVQKTQRNNELFALQTDHKKVPFQPKYLPEKEDFVIGTIQMKLAEYYIVDIGAAQNAVLGIYEFMGATKKNRPQLQIGQNVYCRVIELNKYTKPKLSCIHPTNKKEWMTGESFFGELKSGFVSKIPISLAKHLIGNSSSIFKEIQQYCTFEAAVGINGKLWIQANDYNNTIIISNAISKSKNMSEQEIETFVKQLSEHMTRK